MTATSATISPRANLDADFNNIRDPLCTLAGYSGHGIATASFAGKLIAEAITGMAERFDVFAKLPMRTFPGGTLLRYPGMVLGMLYYSMKDHL